MSVSNAIMVLDYVIALQEIQVRAAQMLQSAQTEGRDITTAELNTLTAERVARRKAWDALGGVV